MGRAVTTDKHRYPELETAWDGLNPPYRTIVADPPWHYEQGGPNTDKRFTPLHPPPYSSMSANAIACLPVDGLAAETAHLYLWTTNRYLSEAFAIVTHWGFKHSQTLTWCKPPKGIGPGGAFTNTTEFILYCRKGNLAYQTRIDTTWWAWPRGSHSAKPSAFLDVVESISPGPYVELFARAPRLGWDHWGHGYESNPSEQA
jgi:N6-adenosine-specific RNA methylase IME4